MTNDYMSLVQANPIIPYKTHGFRASHWCNMVVLMNASVKSFQIDVYANTPERAVYYANNLKMYLEANPMVNRGGVRDDISIGIRNPTLDAVSQAYKAQLIFNAGMLQIINTRIAPVKPYAIPKANAGIDITTEKQLLIDLDGSKSTTYNYQGVLTYLWAFSSLPSGSVAVLIDETSARPSFVPDVEGNYGITLVVNDGTSDSDSDIVVVKATKITAMVMHDTYEVWHDSDQVINTY